MRLETNPELELAYEYVCYTNKSIFLTGKAGTGKTTFLHRIKEEAVKRMAVVAPTGVAAINAKGMTIHSFFQLPFGPFLPGSERDASRQRKFSRDKIRLIRSLELLVIDEISMVRADLLDSIDDVLRRYKNRFQPFGGVQLLMIGDLHQLPPVVKDSDWNLLRTYYDTPYFFSSQVLRENAPVVVQLKHIYRQADDHFIRLLNKVRGNAIDEQTLKALNSRYVPDFEPDDKEGYITLTTHNASANSINARKLNGIKQPVYKFKAEISGDFPTHSYPTDEVLELKEGAQVMFVKNDLGEEKRYYNGKIGKITRIIGEEIFVQCPGEKGEITVLQSEWTNVKYHLNEETKEVVEDIVGAFLQYPLRLAWAITIHKSQGLTFERVILDAQAAFAHGQVYVALSRCKSFEGIVLCSKIAYSSVRTDSKVKNYSREAEKNEPGPQDLEKAKAAYQQTLILELFGFKALERHLGSFQRTLLEHESVIHGGAAEQFKQLDDFADREVFPVVEKFRIQLRRFFAQGDLPEAIGALQDRIRSGCHWFAEKLEKDLIPMADNLQIVTDNKKVRKLAVEGAERIQRELFVKKACFTAIQKGFDTQEYLRTKTNADLDFETVKIKLPSASKSATPKTSPHPELYAQLRQWRNLTAAHKDVEPYKILPAKSLLELTRLLPHTGAQLKLVSGIGKSRIKQYGEDLLDMIQTYCEKHKLQANLDLLDELAPPPKAPKVDTKALTFELYQDGKTIEEIAKERSLKSSTIEGHLAHFIKAGQLDIFDLLDKKVIENAVQYFADHPKATLNEARAALGREYSYGQLKWVRAYVEGGQPPSSTPADL